MIKRILIANRGEIALRVMKTVKERGLTAIAVYSEADTTSLHTRYADEAYLIGPSPPSESYLHIPKIIKVCKEANIDAVHPGYGFLSENAPFAKAVEDAGILFIGPKSKTIASMGDKIEARRIAKKAGLSMTPASEALKNVSESKTEASKIGYPILLKAKAGGGGKGMRIVERESDLEEAFRLAQSEAQKAFKDGTMYMEKYLLHPRHIEVQIFADQNGAVVALGDRECSIQRRHQKIIEEALAPHLSPATRKNLWNAAITVSKAVDYLGAGTVEFLVDEKENFYFLEMNTRLQVEHPVTEWVTGLDLVGLQIDVAEGKKLPFEQKDIHFSGHSIEARVYAEDTNQKFFPAPGTITGLKWPSGPGIRIDSAVEGGSEISLFYDPMIAKISVWGESRDQAVLRLKRALSETKISGVKTNISFLQRIVEHPVYISGKLSTTFLQDFTPLNWKSIPKDDLEAALIAVGLSKGKRFLERRRFPLSPWWQSGLPAKQARGFK